MSTIPLGKGIGNIAKSGIGVFNKTLNRLKQAGLGKGAERKQLLDEQANWKLRTESTDFRVKITLPPDSPLANEFFSGSSPLLPLKDPSSNDNLNGVVFPLTPTVIINHAATYNPLTAQHSNYPFYAYNNSEIPSFTIIGSFPVQNNNDAKYWVGMLHFLRTVTKMFFGDNPLERDNLQGNPPPVLQLNGYGDYVFNKVPVVVTSFNLDLRDDVDYICTEPVEDRRDTATNVDGIITDTKGRSWAPTLSQLQLQLQPVYSKESIAKEFSLMKFAKGKLNGPDIGFI